MPLRRNQVSPDPRIPTVRPLLVATAAILLALSAGASESESSYHPEMAVTSLGTYEAFLAGGGIIADGFESGDTRAWTSATPGPIPVILAIPTSGPAPLNVTFDAAASTGGPGGPISAFEWNYGDGNMASGVLTNNLYTSSGSFEAVLLVVDSLGITNYARETITVTP
ncbi:MAG: PKD domain-containing protein [Deltaproteobacteria bacterium]|nr:PKD domain-containing protein [Deltaproteobacteria bacterium]